MGDKIARAWSTIMEELGYDEQADPHLRESAERVARHLRTWHTKRAKPPKLTVFPNEPRIDELVLCGGIPFTSVCAHHGLLFTGVAAVGYVPDITLLGLSKFARTIDHFARRFQVQERLTHEIVEHLARGLRPKGIGIVMRAEHTCMTSRGARAHGAETITSAMRGVFMTKPEARAELLALIRR